MANVDDLNSWVKYRRKLCRSCKGSCCSLEVEVKAKDLIRMGLMDSFELEEDLKTVAKRLRKGHVISRFHQKTEKFSLARLANGDCIYLDQQTRRCSIYSSRPDTCREHPHVGPRPGYCPYTPLEEAE